MLDLGCGPGEITCEMARRTPGATFVGVDHSTLALARAERLAAGLGLSNVRFEPNNLENYAPPHPVGLVTMFDAFHHVLDPGSFVRRVGQSCDRIFLIEPAGNILGQWEKALDLDWLAESLHVIRDRLEYQFHLTPTAGAGPAPAAPAGEPTEHRYSMDDFSRWFAGYGLDVRGTVAGLAKYGASPQATSALRDDIGESLYRLIVDLETALRRANLDLLAKHWAIYAERHATFPQRRVPDVPKRHVERPLTGPYDAGYDALAGPEEARAGDVFSATVRITNRSWKVWDSHAEANPVLLSYHWIDRKGSTLIEDGLRTPLPRPVAPGEACVAAFRVQCPPAAGRYVLAIDLVHEGVTWFSQAGVPALRTDVHVT